MSSKYQTSSSTMLRGRGREIALTDHAIHRFRERTPHDRDVSIRECWRRGEWIEHPNVAQSPDEEHIDDARVYRHGDAWGIVFVVVRDRRPNVVGSLDGADWVVPTIINIDGYDHGPSRAYLHGYGPHYTPESG